MFTPYTVNLNEQTIEPMNRLVKIVFESELFRNFATFQS